MSAQVARVVAGAMNETRLSAAQKGHPQQIHTRRLDDSTGVANLALAVEHGHMEP